MSRQPYIVNKVHDELLRYAEVKAAVEGLDPEADLQTILDTVEGETDLAEILTGIADTISDDKERLTGVEARLEDIQARKAALKNSIEWKRTLILQAMDTAGIPSIKGPEVTLSCRSVAAGLQIIEEADIPAEFWKAGKPILDRKTLKEKLTDGESVSGASLDNGGISLVVTTTY